MDYYFHMAFNYTSKAVVMKCKNLINSNFIQVIVVINMDFIILIKD
jgi:hypothetical protein